MSTHHERVAVLMGGWTPEASVSRVSASFCGQAARNAGWDAVEIEVERDIAARLAELLLSRFLTLIAKQSAGRMSCCQQPFIQH